MSSSSSAPAPVTASAPSPVPEPLRVAIVGTGNIARFHAQALLAEPGRAALVAAVDVDPGALESFRSRHTIPRGYADLDRMLTAERPDLVHVCTPPGIHRAQVEACLGAGASVLVEKPPALSLAEAEKMAAAEGGDRGPWMATVFQHRFGSGALRLRALIDSGVLGRPLLATCHTTWFRPQEYFDLPWRGKWETEGGGPTLGHGIHQTDLLLALLGEWTQVSAVVRRQARDVETEDVSLARVDFASGAIASVVTSLLSPQEESRIRIDFERATVELAHLYGYGDDDWRLTPAPGFEEEITTAWEAGEHGVNSGHHSQIVQVLDALRAGSPPPVTSRDALSSLRLVAAVYASSFEQRPVTPADLAPGSPFHERMNGGRSL
ncbi:Gfo/Idh/MocA family protein [Nocardiopsis metallicus]|uniref:Putative dehydrogenase n=1 Tax=Nocardiopsis metallicus TaxID=179819 RepID=A0A840WQH5_9ACTN|nr:Gfo/Idh/MocA family oxidoreductase [Nocardiopsis metallicus]MBB5493847.1 putative dehydrogenase [Nocardiopsis metallicus]